MRRRGSFAYVGAYQGRRALQEIRTGLAGDRRTLGCVSALYSSEPLERKVHLKQETPPLGNDGVSSVGDGETGFRKPVLDPTDT